MLIMSQKFEAEYYQWKKLESLKTFFFISLLTCPDEG